MKQGRDPSSRPAESTGRRVWTVWLPIVAAAVPAAMFLLIGSGVRQPNGVPYRCPSAARQLIGGSGLKIRPTMDPGELRLYDPRDPALVNPPGVWDRCRTKNTQAALIAGVALCLGVGVSIVRVTASGWKAPTGTGGAGHGGRRAPWLGPVARG
jgi:hypothetical protein